MRRFLTGLVLAGSLAAPTAGQSLFTAISGPNPDAEPPPELTAAYQVTIDTDVLATNPSTLTIDLPSGQITLIQEHFDPILGFDEFGVPLPVPSSERHYTWSGEGDGYQAIITHYKGATMASFWGATYYNLRLRPGANLSEDLSDQHLLEQPGDPLVPIHGEDPALSAAAVAEYRKSRQARDARARDVLNRFPHKTHEPPDTVEMLIFYSDALLAEKGGSVFEIETIAEKGISDINEHLRNSEINAVVRSVGVESLPGFVETTSQEDDRDDLQRNALLRQRRAALQADVVMVLLEHSSLINRCGIAYGQRPGCGETAPIPGCDMGLQFAQFAIFNAAWNCVDGYGTAAHEFGHLNSAEHQVGATLPDEDLAYAYCHAHYFTVNGEGRRTALYVAANIQKVPNYSDPEITHEGETTGAVGTRENARAIREVIVTTSILGTVVFIDNFESGNVDAWGEVEGFVP